MYDLIIIIFLANSASTLRLCGKKNPGDRCAYLRERFIWYQETSIQHPVSRTQHLPLQYRPQQNQKLLAIILDQFFILYGFFKIRIEF